MDGEKKSQRDVVRPEGKERGKGGLLELLTLRSRGGGERASAVARKKKNSPVASFGKKRKGKKKCHSDSIVQKGRGPHGKEKKKGRFRQFSFGRKGRGGGDTLTATKRRWGGKEMVIASGKQRKIEPAPPRKEKEGEGKSSRAGRLLFR